MPNRINYSKLIDDYCKENHKTIYQLANELNGSVRSLHRWKSGGIYPSLSWRVKLNEFFKINTLEKTSDIFIIEPEKVKEKTKSIIVSESFYDILKEMSYMSGQKLKHVTEQCIQFAYEHFNG